MSCQVTHLYDFCSFENALEWTIQRECAGYAPRVS